MFENDKLYLLPVQGSDTQWYKNVLKNPTIQVDAGGAKAEVKVIPITDAKQVSSVVEKFRAKYGAGETVTSSVATMWAMVLATFKPSAAGSGAVLDPGFYYFNGSGFAGGGGICLNGGTLLARDVTLEFVNQAGFSSGDCSPGGGAACTGTCRFGSTPCSLSSNNCKR